jgi:hypothetical protein
VSVIVENIHNEIKQYLLGQLTEDAEERVELRLMSDTAYTQEFDAAVAEITDQYVAGEFRGEERKHVEEYFLASEERRNQARFVAALKNHANAERGALRAVSGPKVRDSAVKPAGQLEPAVVAGLWHSWSSQPAAWRLATATALLVMLVGLYMLVQMGGGSRTAFASLELTISESDRATGSTAPSITRDAAQLRATLRFPASMPEARDYRVKLASDPTKTFTPIEKHSDSITVQIPIAYFREGRNGLQLFVIKPDGTEERVRGTYYFDLK